MALTVAQKNELATRLVNAQQTGNYGSFNDLVKQLRLTQADFLENFPAINQAGINEQIGRGAVVPTAAPAATTYTTPQVTSAIRDALNAGFTVQQARQGAMTNFGLSSADFDKALEQVQSTNYNTTFTDARVAQAIRDSLAQGFTLDQARQGALANYGVSDTQFNRALALVSGGTQGIRGSAPLYQFPGLLAGREDMGVGAQRFLSRAPGSLLFDVPKVEGGQFTFTPGPFDYQAIREQLGTSSNQTVDSETAANANALAAYNAAQGKTTVPPITVPDVKKTPTSVVEKSTTPIQTQKYTDERVAQAIRESMDQGFSLLDSMAGATRVYGVPVEQVSRAADLLGGSLLSDQSMAAPTMTAAYVPPTIEDVTPITSVSPAPENATTITSVQSNLLSNPTQFTDAQVAQAIIDSLGQGFSMDQIRMGAFNNFGVTPEQFTSASGMLPSMGYNIGQGFR